MRTLLIFLFLGLISTATLAQADLKTILAGSVIDVRTGKDSKNVLIEINGNVISRVTPNFKGDLPENTIDLSGYTVLPGLIDVHTHLSGVWYLDQEEYDEYESPMATYGIWGAVNAKKTIEAGFTTVRDVHGEYYSDVAIRDAINKGWIPGPRMYVTGPGLSITGGHGAWGNWLSPQLALEKNPGSIVDGVDEARKETREHLKHNVDWIKVFATGGFGSYGTIPGAASFAIEEMKAIVEEAQKRGVNVLAHAHGADGIKNAIEAGVRSIEHATFLDDEAINLLIENDVYLVMDLLSAYFDLIELEHDYEDKELGMENQEVYDQIEARFTKAYKAGVKMAFGTDAGVYEHGKNAQQFKLMKEAGMSELEILKTATVNAADLLELSDYAGAVEEGKWADLIAVKGDPLSDITVLENVEFVMKEGMVFKDVR